MKRLILPLLLLITLAGTAQAQQGTAAYPLGTHEVGPQLPQFYVPGYTLHVAPDAVISEKTLSEFHAWNTITAKFNEYGVTWLTQSPLQLWTDGAIIESDCVPNGDLLQPYTLSARYRYWWWEKN